MKTLKFDESLVSLIKDGSKTVTYRFFDEKDLSQGDEIEFINKQSGEVFAKVILTKVYEKSINELTAEDLLGHEPLPKDSIGIRDHYRDFYGDKIEVDSLLKIVIFEIKEFI